MNSTTISITKLVKPARQVEISASCEKIPWQEAVEAEEIDEEKWTKLKGRSIVSGERLQERLRNASSCRLIKEM